MKRSRAIAYAAAHPERAGWAWLLLALLAVVAILLAMAQAAADTAAGAPEMPSFAAAGDAQPDCGESHGPAEGHCHVSAACSGYAQLNASAVCDEHATDRHPLPMTDGIHLSRAPTPDPQPPKHSCQA